MATIIKDGTGSNSSAGVNDNNRLLVDSITRPDRQDIATLGEAYLIGTGPVTLTTAGAPSAVLYFKNNEEEDLIVTRFLISCAFSTGASATENTLLGIIYKNPTGMSSGSTNPLAINNVNFGSNNTIDSNSEIGADSASLTGSPSAYFSIYAPLETLTAEDATTILPKGSSIGVVIIPPASLTAGALIVSVGINAHKKL